MSSPETDSRVSECVQRALNKSVFELIGMKEIRWHFRQARETEEVYGKISPSDFAILAVESSAQAAAINLLIAEIVELVRQNRMLEFQIKALRKQLVT